MFLFLPAGSYPLKSVNDRLVEVIGACYSQAGSINGKPAVYSPYSSKSEDVCNGNSNTNSGQVTGHAGVEQGWSRTGGGGD